MELGKGLPLEKRTIQECRKIAKKIGSEVLDLVENHSTVGTERALLRLFGFNSAIQTEELFYPISNYIVDQLVKENRLSEGVSYWVANALLSLNCDIPTLEKKIIAQDIDLGSIPAHPFRTEVIQLANKLSKQKLTELGLHRKNRTKKLKHLKDPALEKKPLKYVIVATGNIFEDILQAESAALDGADIIAVIRSTAQSLLDYVPQGTTTEGFGGTYATQANFRVMREALDTLSKKIGRNLRLTNYCSGLCMSEIAVLAAMEGLDCLLNDAMYGILFRDINPYRTLIDQHFSRMICAFSDIWIMTGEDNYLKTTDAKESGDQVLASQFINEVSALNAGISPKQLCIGHAMEMDPKYTKVILYEIARAQMTKQIFPESPLKFMCNTKYKTGDIFTSHAIDTIFNLIGSITNQGMLLLGMPTEAIHTPFLYDRSLSLRSANYVLEGSLGLHNEISFNPKGEIALFANQVLKGCHKILNAIQKKGLIQSIEARTFAGVSRKPKEGKGWDGVFKIDKKKYINPFFKLLQSSI